MKFWSKTCNDDDDHLSLAAKGKENTHPHRKTKTKSCRCFNMHGVCKIWFQWWKNFFSLKICEKINAQGILPARHHCQVQRRSRTEEGSKMKGWLHSWSMQEWSNQRRIPIQGLDQELENPFRCHHFHYHDLSYSWQL